MKAPKSKIGGVGRVITKAEKEAEKKREKELAEKPKKDSAGG